MSRFLVPGGLAALAALSGTLPGCDGCKSSNNPVADAGSPDAPGSDTLSITPSSANVLTCDEQQFQESGGAAGGVWSVAPSTAAGTINASGDYSAPLVVPTNPDATITYTAGAASASATVTLGTAFVGAVSSVPIAGNADIVEFDPIDHQFAANGSLVYTAIAVPADPVTDAVLGFDIYASSGAGAAFSQVSTYATGDLSCGAIAVDAGDPQTVYLAYEAEHADSTTNSGSTIRLAVSTDGGATFPVEYVLADTGAGNANWAGCPDVASASAGNVIVTQGFDPELPDGQVFWTATFVSNDHGANIGSAASGGVALGSDDAYLAATDTNSASATAAALNENGLLSPRVFTNGDGGACIVYMTYPDGGVVVQCSSNSGSTWSAPTTVVASSVLGVATGAMSPGGDVAIAYEQQVTDATGTGDQTFVVFSRDGGQTWGQPIEHPLPAFAGGGLSTVEAFVRWEGDGILWLAQRTNENADELGVLVDKTCDYGQSWSGSVNGGDYEVAGLFATSAGMSVGIDLSSETPDGPMLGVIPLSP